MNSRGNTVSARGAYLVAWTFTWTSINEQAAHIYFIPKQFAMETTRRDSFICCLYGTW